MKKIYKYTILLMTLLVINTAVKAIGNDDCSTATNLGTLPAPAACTGTTIMPGVPVTVSGTTVGATPEAIYPYLSHCAINTSSPPNDVWYSFVASSYQAVVSIAGSTMANPVITVWTGTCGTLTGMGCVSGTGGAATITIYQTVPGQTYFIQVAGSTSAQNGTFNLTVRNDHDCAQCLTSSSISATPPPTNGAYAPGTRVTFCLTVSHYTQILNNWLHGVQPTFGAGWDMSTLTAGTPPGSVDGAGSWAYYPSGVVSTATGTAWPGGFYYNSRNPHNLVGGPGNSYGDNCPSGNCTWTFCFSITTNSACSPGSDLGVTIRTSADGESGTWTSPGCASDPVASISAIGACCPPLVSSSPDTCGNGLGSATATAIGANGPWTYRWSAGVPATQITNGPSTVYGLTAGTVTVTVTDRYNCTSTANITIVQTSFAGPNQGASCVTSLPGGSVTMGALSTGTWSVMSGNPGTAVIANNTDPHTIISNYTAAGTYNFLFSRAGGCQDTAQVTVTVKPNAGGDRLVPCILSYPGGAAGMSATPIAGASWTAMAGNPGTATIVTPSSPNTIINNFSGPGVYSWIWTNPSGCVDTATTTVTTKPNAGPDQVQNCVALPGAPATLAATAVAGGVWTALPSNPAVATIASPSSPNTGVSGFSAGGVYNFVWTVPSGCNDTAAVIINPQPIAPPAVASVGTICMGSSTNLVATSPGNNILWYTTSSGGSPLTTVASGANYTVSPATTTTYYAEAQSIGGGTYTTTYNYTGAAQSWTVPAGATTATMYIWGGGGGGGAYTAGTPPNYGNGGGGGGGAASVNTIPLTSGQIYTINIGAGGTSGSTGGTVPGAGGTSTVVGPSSTYTAGGGAGGTNQTVGTNNATAAGGAGGGTGTGTVFAGGAGSAGNNGNSGGSGITGTGGGGGGSGAAGTSPLSSCGVSGTGGTGTYPGGNGGYNTNCAVTSDLAGIAGSVPGGGGSGNNTWNNGTAGGAGGAGRVVIVYTIPTCTSPSRTAVTVTVRPVPAAVTVTGGGTFCNNATLTATGGGGNTIYWQNTTSNGVSTATPSTSQTVSTSGTYYFNAYNGTCFGPQGSATVTINTAPAAPTATATPATICVGASSNLVGTSVGNNINWYTVATGGTAVTTTASGATYTVSPASTTTYYAEAVTSAVGGSATYTTTGASTWTVPAGVTSATVYLWGGGGGGGAGRSNNNVSGGGGGGGAAGYVTLSSLTPGDVYTVNVGSGGAGGSGSAGATAGSGGASSITGTLGTWSINGGNGGTDNNGGTSGTGGAGASTGAGAGLALNNGGNGSSGNTATNTGQGGGGGGSTGAGANGSTLCPGGAAAGGSGTYSGGNGGYNPNCGSTTSAAGVSGSAAGGGGSGGYRGTSSSQNGGNGGNGQVIIVYNVTTCPSTRTPVTVTVNPVPTATTVSGGGAYCNAAVLTASGGTGGTIYWQNTTSGGTSTATPSSSQTVTTTGTYYFNSYNGGCWGPQGSASVTITAGPAAPTVSPSSATICSGSSTTLTATSASAADTIKWYTASIGGTLLTSGLSPKSYTVSPVTTTTYYAEAQPPVTTSTFTQTYTASGSWTVPVGAISATMYLVGGGGGGGAATVNPNGSRFYVNGGGGGGGASSVNGGIALTAGQTYTITIGAGGVGGTTAGTAPTGGGTTTIVNGATTYSAIGGSAGNNQGSNATSATAAGGAGGNTGTGTVYAGGSGSAGNNGNSAASGVSGTGGGGGGSGSAGTSPASACGVVGTGGSGTYPGGNGGYNTQCGNATNQAGSNGNAPGGGGSGNSSWTSRTAGGNGGNGQVVIVYTIASASCPSPRTPVTVTVNNVPTPVTVTGGGASCTNAVLTATGGTGGTIYWQNTTTNGTSTATPSTSQTVASNVTYYFRANNSCGWSVQGSATPMISAKPNAGADKTACQGGIATMAATTVAGGVWSAMAGNPGTATITSPSTAATTITGFSVVGTYNFIWTSGAGCTDTAAVTVSPNPSATVANNTPLCVGNSLTATATPSVAGSYTYSWSGPASYSATGASFTIATTTLANNGNYTLTITNTATSCSASIVTNMAVISCFSVNGSIFDDANGNGIVDGTDAATSRGQTLYAVLADTTGAVVSVGAIAANGSYSVGNVLPNTAGYSISVRGSSPAIGSPSPGYSWPTNWVGTRAQYGTNNLEGSGVYPGSELVHIAIASTNVTGLMIGYDLLPVATTQTYTIPYPHANTTKTITPSNGLGLLAGSDPEDGSYTTGSTFVISSVSAMNGNQLFYDANGDGILQSYEQITGYTVITSFDATRLQIRFVGAGSTQAAFSYSTIDAAAQVAATSAIYTIRWVGTLPVKMLYFTAQKNGNESSLLKWATASEIDNDHFEIEHSPDAQSWEKIGTVQGNGTTSEEKVYSFTDARPVQGSNYYRLKQVDIDGHFTYTDVVEVEFENPTVSPVSLTVYPNPVNANGVLNLKLSSPSDNIKNVTITNAIGQIVHNEATPEVPSYQLFDHHLPSGVYQITIQTLNNNTLTQKVVVQ